MKQLLYYQKQHKQIKEDHSHFKQEFDKLKKEEEQTDRMLASKLDKKDVHMPTIMHNKKMNGTAGGASNQLFRMMNSSSKGFKAAVPVPPSASAMQKMPYDKRTGTAPNGAFGRPKTAGLMQDVVQSAPGVRPQTGAVGQPNGLPPKNSLKQFAPIGAARAASAGFS